jgi:mycothiol synthase
VLAEHLRRPNYSPEQDMFVIEAAGEIAGFINLTPELAIRRVLIDYFIHPQHRRRGLAKGLLDHATQRASELGAEVLQANVRRDNSSTRKTLSRLGFRMVRRFLELRLAISELPEVAHHAYSLRYLESGEEALLAHLQNRCFADTWGYNPNTAEEIAYSLKLSGASAQDVTLVCEQGRPVGYCWARINCGSERGGEGKRGRIFMLGVDPSYRGRGIGKIALLAGLAHLKSRGVLTVELTVDSQNQAALALYHSLGFELWTSSLYYEKRIA